MKSISSWSGLIYPDEYVIRFFFKLGLHRRPGRVLELGSGVGNNLALFRGFDWSVVGMDNDALSLQRAGDNLQSSSDPQCELLFRDIEATNIGDLGDFDCVMAPNLACYLTPSRFISVLHECASLLKPGGAFFLKTRLVDDWRAGRGPAVGTNSYILTTEITGESGAMMTLYERDELASLVDEHLGLLDDRAVMRTSYENLQSGEMIDNHDAVIWGRSRR
jgi:SAM-dependent methyltransferase